MSLETFIARDLEVMEQQIQSMVNEQNEDDNNDEPLDTTEKITTEDILGNISESDTSDDEEESSSFISVSQNQTNEISGKPHHHKHSKKRLKTSHIPSTSTDAAALQLSEDEL